MENNNTVPYCDTIIINNYQNFGKKVKCPGGLPGVECVMGSFRIDWFIKLAKLQILKKFTFPFGKS